MSSGRQVMCARKPLPSCDHFHLNSYRHMSPEQFGGASAAHFPVSSHSFSCAVKKLEQKMSCCVHFQS